MKLITEVTEDCTVFTESTENGKKGHFIEGIFMQGDIKNRNGRIYPSAILEKEMQRYDKDFIQTKRALGELNHPNGPQINGERVSHLITSMKKDGSNFVGKAKILSTPMGEIVKTLIDEGVKIGVSTRGLGSVKPTNEGIMEVQNDFHLATVDIVTDPSGPNCFVNGIMENTEYYFDIATSSWKEASGIVETTSVHPSVDKELYNEAMERIQMLEDTIKQLKKAPTKQARRVDEASAIRMFESYMSSLRK